MVDKFDKQQPCRSETVASDFIPLFAQLTKPAALAPLDAGLTTLVATMNTPRFRCLNPKRR